MCNLYSQTKSQAEIVSISGAVGNRAGNLPAQPAIFPDQLAPVVRLGKDGRELVKMRWGIPGPSIFGGKPVTNVRNTSSRHWSAMLKDRRCLVPATSFSEYADKPDPKTKKKPIIWFALSEDRPLFFFAGIWREWEGTRGTKSDPATGKHVLFSFLTTDPNKVVKPVHAKAMPVILTKPAEWNAWLEAPVEKALELQRPLPDSQLKIVRQGFEKHDQK